jgi:shikimate kinase
MSDKVNIAIIGMPGAGKTTIGKMLAQSLNREFIDTDQYIESSSGMTVAEIFGHGETFFRDLEAAAYKNISEGTQRVIATGGGAVKSKDNMNNLQGTSLVVFIDRPVEQIAKDIDFSTRPLLKDGIKSLRKLYDERIELYKGYSDIIVRNEATMEALVKNIISMIGEDNNESIAY